LLSCCLETLEFRTRPNVGFPPIWSAEQRLLFAALEPEADGLLSTNNRQGVSKTWGSLLALGGLIGLADA